MEKNYGLDQKVNGKSIQESMADLLERNERNEIELERAKVSIAIWARETTRSLFRCLLRD